jgi:rRNA processing protein Gar1
MSSDESGQEEEGEYFDSVAKIEVDYAIEKVFGKDLKLLGFVLNKIGDLLIVETSDSSLFRPGNYVLYEDYREFGHIVDIFGPTAHPLYVVRPSKGKDNNELTGTPVYICNSLCEREILEERSDPGSDGDISESSDEEGAFEIE